MPSVVVFFIEANSLSSVIQINIFREGPRGDPIRRNPKEQT